MRKIELPQEYSFERYLSAKASVDARAFHPGLWKSLLDHLDGEKKKRLQVLEVGGGIGTMARKFISQCQHLAGTYTIVEQDAALIKFAQNNLKDWADKVASPAKAHQEIVFQMQKGDWRIDFIPMDIYQWLAQQKNEKRLDLIIGHAILDLLDIPKFFSESFPLLSEDALFYFPINYDGLSIFEPAIMPSLEAQIWAFYHQSMDERLIDGKPSGDSKTGRHLFSHINDTGARVLAAGSSDWLVFPGKDGYLEDEAYFLLHILNIIEDQLIDHPDLERSAFENWLVQRRAQVLAGELIFLAHQIDVLGCRT